MSIRTKRLASVLQRDIGKILQRSYQPSGSFLTVRNVEVTDDLLIAKVFISVYAPGKDENVIFEQLEQANTEIRKELASKIRHQVRRIPELIFNKDNSAAYAEKMDRLFDEIRAEREARHDDEEE